MTDPRDPFPDMEPSPIERELLLWLVLISGAITGLGIWKFLELIGVL